MDIGQLSDDDIIAEVRKLQYLYGLKREIRYGRSRHSDHDTESVAEHVFGMHILAFYFLEIEDPLRQWDREKIFTMITTHDLDEIETGDTVAYIKTAADYEAEEKAREVVIEMAPLLIHSVLLENSAEYEAKETMEALFVRAIDNIEPLFHLYNEPGKKLLHESKTTIEQCRRTKDDHVKHFASIKRFADTLHARMVAEGYFYVETTPSTESN